MSNRNDKSESRQGRNLQAGLATTPDAAKKMFEEYKKKHPDSEKQWQSFLTKPKETPGGKKPDQKKKPQPSKRPDTKKSPIKKKPTAPKKKTYEGMTPANRKQTLKDSGDALKNMDRSTKSKVLGAIGGAAGTARKMYSDRLKQIKSNPKSLNDKATAFALSKNFVKGSEAVGEVIGASIGAVTGLAGAAATGSRWVLPASFRAGPQSQQPYSVSSHPSSNRA